jgi:hypothetical protein
VVEQATVDPGLRGATIDVAGPENLSFDQVVDVGVAIVVVACTSVLTRCSPPPLEQAAATTTKAVVARTTIGRRGPAVGTRRAYASDRRFRARLPRSATRVPRGDMATDTKAPRSASSIVLMTLAAGQFLMTLDSSVMNVSIATVAKDVGTDVTGIQTAITLYTLVMASLMITGARSAPSSVGAAFSIGCVIYDLGSFTTDRAEPQRLIRLVVPRAPAPR